MRLSEAIRLGSMLRPQGFEDYFPGDGSCALGSALDSAFSVVPITNAGRALLLDVTWPWLTKPVPVECPDCGSFVYLFWHVVSTHLNDKHRWTRERIADWVETVEPKIEAAKEEIAVAELVAL